MKSIKSSDPEPQFDPLARYLSIICAVIIVLLPFHAFLTVWAASLIGHYTALRLWKEVLLVVVFAGAVIVAARNRPEWSAVRKIFGSTVRCSLAKLYGALCVAAVVIAYAAGGVTFKAAVFGLILDLRFLTFFGIVWLVSAHGGQLIYKYWRPLLLIPAAAVIVFGLLQFTVLPADFLRHFGYGPDTIPAIQTIDQKAAYQRIQSTLRGANPLGTYMVLIITAVSALLLKKSKHRVWYALGFAAACLTLALTYSRSAWIGSVIAVGWLIFQALRASKLLRNVLVAVAVAVMAFAGAGYTLRNNDTFQNTFFHTDEHSQSSESSNQGHFAATASGLKDIIKYPLGSGTGTAGPASLYNNHPARIAENYFVQIGQETGVLGLGLFIAINVLLGLELWRRRGNPLAVVLLASLFGINFINLLSHAWTDDTISYIWWGLAGAVIAVPVQTGTGAAKKRSEQ